MAAGDRKATDEEVAAWRIGPASAYAEKRRLEYPPISDQLDALWKGGAEAEAMKARIDAVKLKYPKPIGGGK